MKNRITLGVLGCLFTCVASGAIAIGTKWDFDIWTAPYQTWDYGPTNPFSWPLLGSGLLNGSGVTYTSAGGSIVGPSGVATDRAPQAKLWTTSPTPDPNDCFKVHVVPSQAGPAIHVLGISFWLKNNGGGSGGPTKCSLDYSTNGLFWVPLFADSAVTGNWKRVFCPLNSSLVINQILWYRISGYAATLSTGTLAIDSIKIYVQAPVPLPVQLVDFTGKQEDDAVRLDWQTATESGNDHFTVDRSLDLSNWETVATVAGAGNSVSDEEYRYFDHPEPGLVYYRLSQTDEDGQSKICGTISVLVRRAVIWSMVGDNLITDESVELFTTDGKCVSILGRRHALESGRTYIFKRPQDPFGIKVSLVNP